MLSYNSCQIKDKKNSKDKNKKTFKKVLTLTLQKGNIINVA